MENEYQPYRNNIHRSISQLIAHLDDFRGSESGIENPALDDYELNNASLYTQFDAQAMTHVPNGIDNHPPAAGDRDSISGTDEEIEKEDNDEVPATGLSRCLPEFQLSLIESEYDENLYIPENETDDDDDDNKSNTDGEVELPFTSIYELGVKFKSIQRKAFIPGEEISVSITGNERSVTTHFLSPNLYNIEMRHGNYTWTIKRRYKHFSSLHQQLIFFRTSLNIFLPTRSHKEKRANMKHVANQMADEAQKKELQAGQSFKSQRNAVVRHNSLNNKITRLPSNALSHSNKPMKKKKKKRKLPRFPNRPESLILVEALPLRIKQLEDYLYNLLNISLYRNHHETLNFVEVSNLSFVSGLGKKGKEGMLQKRTGSTHPGQGGCNFCGIFQQACCLRCSYFCSDVIYGQWKNRWFFIKETCFGYIRPKDGVIRSVILFDQGFDVSTGIYQTGMRKGLQIITNNRLVLLKCWTRRRCNDWMEYFKHTQYNDARDFTQQNPHKSYAPVRKGMQASWYVDGSSYMAAVADAIEAATEEIYIADWWLSPEIYMKRPALNDDYWRLDKMLLRKATQGVKIFVLLYKEVEVAIGINSYYSKQVLVRLHENIKVLRHPDHARAGVIFWAHHEKIVAVDQTYAFIGGIDLCYGRWDDFRHRLSDLGSEFSSSISGSTRRPETYISKEDADSAFGSRNSSRNMKTADTKNSQEKQNEIQITPNNLTLPETHAYGPETRVLAPGEKLVIGPTIDENVNAMEGLKLNTPEMERKNVLDIFKTRGKDFVNMITNDVTKAGVYTIEENKNLDDWHMSALQSEDTYDGEAKYWYGKDYSNLIIKDWMNLDSPFVDIIDRATTPRMPWHDIGVCVIGASARDVSRHFIQRWNSIKLLKMRDNTSFPYLLPKSYNDIKLNPNLAHRRQSNVTCQLLRSLSAWSGGFIEQDLYEQSIHEAYIDTISNAQHYIYIENQFFITMQMASSGNSVHNQIGETLFKRILKAHKERKKFRVYVIMPLLPGFEGDVGGTTGNAVRAITHWNYSSISRGRTGILTRLKEVGIKDPSEYISFNSLRTHSHLNNSPITELVYVHSKLLIADDKVVICGSANINDRSLIGKRDSEIAALITDEEFEDGIINEQPCPSGKFAGRLRKYLFQEHLGLLENNINSNNTGNKTYIDIRDPVSDKFWKDTWQKIATKNTKIYNEVFKCLPTDSVKSYADLRKFQEEQPLHKSDPKQAAQRIESIQGFLVNLPLEFLATEVLTPPGTSKEGIIPTSVWT